ncbi:MAG: TssN family type VI secretion system protein [Polaribacter sp.]
MSVLIAFFLKYLLAPIIVIASLVIMDSLAKGKSVLKMKRLIVFILIVALILALPSLLGLLKYEFVWGGLTISTIIYIILGYCLNLFSKTSLFKSFGYNDRKWLILLGYAISVVLGGWIYYLAFTWLSKLDYGAWAMWNLLWVFLPVFYLFSKEKFIDIPTAFYNLWIIEKDKRDEEFWNNIDTFRLMQVTIKVKRNINSKRYASFSVKMPKDVTIGRWFNRFVEDQNIRFPSDVIETEAEKGSYGWIFYTNRWLPFPLFTRMLNFDQDIVKNKIKNKMTIYARRVLQNELPTEETTTNETTKS